MEPNLIEIETTTVPWRYDVPRYFLDQAVARKLDKDDDE